MQIHEAMMSLPVYFLLKQAVLVSSLNFDTDTGKV